MARADLLCDLIKSGLAGEEQNFRKATEAICAEERAKQHEILAKKIEEILKAYSRSTQHKEVPSQAFNINGNGVHFFQEIAPERG